MNPMYFAPLTGNGEKGWFGWAKDDKLEQLKSEFVATTDPATRKRVAQEIQVEAYDAGLLAPLGEIRPLSVIRRGVVSGVITAPVNVFWNIKKQNPE